MTSSLPSLLVLLGPTASGKTGLSIELALRLNAEILSADSRQIYKHLDIGTAKPTQEQLEAVRHHFINEKLPTETFSAGQFGIEGRRVIADIHARGKEAIVVGGSGLYIQSLTDGLFDGPEADPEIREVLEAKVAHGMTGDLLDELRRVDPDSAVTADITKPRRIIRALEVFYLTGKPLSMHHRELKPEIGFSPLFVGLAWDRQLLYKHIEQRCDAMLEAGLEHEVSGLQAMGYDRRLNALNTVGYAEVFAYKNGEISHEEMVRLFKQNSRRYAKRQMTWFRRDGRIQWVAMKEDRAPEDVLSEILAASRQRSQA